MAVTQGELITALQTLLSTTDVRLLMRTGLASQLDLASMVAGEFAVATDTQEVYACFGDGIFRNLARGIVIKGVYADLSALQAAHPTGAEGDIYAAGSAPQHLYVWTASTWTDMGAWNDTTLFATSAEVGAIDARLTTAESDIGTLETTTTALRTAYNATVTITSGESGNITLKRIGDTVQAIGYVIIAAGLSTTTKTNYWNTIPLGYRPALAIQNAEAQCATGGTNYTSFVVGSLDVSTGGAASVVASATGKTVAIFNTTWLTSDAYPV